MIIPLVGVGALVAYYLYQKRNVHPNVQTEGSYQAAPQPPAPPAPINYPPATTKLDPATQGNNVIRYQAAQPVPSGRTYLPAAGDKPGSVMGRLVGNSKNYLDGKPAPGEAIILNSKWPSGGDTLAQLGKLNGFVAFNDLKDWIAARKPLLLPSGYRDVSGPATGAMGSIG